MLILALCGSLLLLALCLMAGVIFFLRCSHRKEVIRQEEPHSSAASSCSDPKNTSSHQLMPELMAELSSRIPIPPSSLPDSTPTYWSASQLLTEHEQRALSTSYGPLADTSSYGPCSPSCLPSIREEGSLQEGGLTNQGFRQSHGTPVHGLLEPRTRDSEASDRSSVSGLSLLYRAAVLEAPREEDSEGSEEPVRFSTAVQTVEPSTIATLRQNRDYMASIKSRSVSLV